MDGYILSLSLSLSVWLVLLMCIFFSQASSKESEEVRRSQKESEGVRRSQKESEGAGSQKAIGAEAWQGPCWHGREVTEAWQSLKRSQGGPILLLPSLTPSLTRSLVFLPPPRQPNSNANQVWDQNWESLVSQQHCDSNSSLKAEALSLLVTQEIFTVISFPFFPPFLSSLPLPPSLPPFPSFPPFLPCICRYITHGRKERIRIEIITRSGK